MDINKLYQYITTFNLITITIQNIAINTGRLWQRPVLGQSEIVCTVAILDVQGDTDISLCRERSLARWRVLAFRRGTLGRAARVHIVERTSIVPVPCHDLQPDRNGPKRTKTDRSGPKRTYENTETDFYEYRRRLKYG